MMRSLYRLADRLFYAMAVMGIIGLIGAIVIVVFDIVARRSLGFSVLGTVDLTQLCVMAAASWSIPFAFSRKAHVSIDIATKNLSLRRQNVLDGFASFAGFVLMVFTFWLSFEQATLIYLQGDRSQDLEIPMIAYWVFLLSGSFMSCIACFLMTIRTFKIS